MALDTNGTNESGTKDANGGLLQSLSSELAALTARAAASIVRVDDGSRLTATGLVWSADGLIVTTSHGVEQDENLFVELADGTRLPAVVVGRDGDSDIALLRVQDANLAPIPQAAPDEAQVGSLVLAIARPGAGGLQATLGVLTARTETQSRGREEHVLHTDAVLYPGFSGGALVAMNGNVVGLANLMFGRGKGVALGTSLVANVVSALLTTGSARRGYLGISTQQAALPANLRTSLNLQQEHALLIVQVESGSGAEQGGLFMGDTLLKLNGQSVADVDSLRQHLRGQQAGQTLDLQILRGGELRDVQVTLGSQG